DDVLSVLSHVTEDTWDRGESVLVFWVWRGFESRRLHGTATGRAPACRSYRATGHQKLRVLRLSTTDVARPRLGGTHLGRPALGRVPRHARLSATPSLLSDVRHPHRAGRLRRSESAHHATTSAAHWAGLPVDADVASCRAPRCQLEQSAPRRESVLAGVG